MDITKKITTGVSTPWNYSLDLSYTKKAWTANSLAAKVTRCSVLGIAALAILETISEVVKLFFKIIGNTFHLYKFSMLKAKEMPQGPKTIDYEKLRKKAKIVGLTALGVSVMGVIGKLTYNLITANFAAEVSKDVVAEPSYMTTIFNGIIANSGLLLKIGSAAV